MDIDIFPEGTPSSQEDVPFALEPDEAPNLPPPVEEEKEETDQIQQNLEAILGSKLPPKVETKIKEALMWYKIHLKRLKV